MADNKDKKVLNVPALRFPEFTREWKEHYLAEYLDFKNGLNPSANKFGSGIKFISVMDILNNDFITYDCIRTSVEITPEEQVAFAVEKGDMLFQRSSETLEDVGRANVYMDDRSAVFGGFVIRGKKKAEYNPMFFRYLLASPYARKKVIPMGAGAQHFNIGQDGLSKVRLHFPVLQEQHKIATLLRLIDDRISTQNKIIEKLETLIKGIVDSIFTANKFPKVPFKEIYVRAGEGGTPSTSNPEYYDNGTIPFIKIDDLQNKYIKTNKDCITDLGLQKSSAWIVPANSIIYSNGATIGAISINLFPVCTKQGILGVVPKADINVEFLYYFMTSTAFTKAVERIVTEGTMRTAYLKDINHIPCPVPYPVKQDEIAKMLSTLSEKLENEVIFQMKLQKQKEFLLSQMFI
ncbi:restriction endonuclease subunit S [Marseilla massiliensis]